MKRKRYSHEETKMICDMFAAGKGVKEIAEECAAKYGTARSERQLRQHNKNNAASFTATPVVMAAEPVTV